MRTALKKFQTLLDENPEEAKKEFPKMMKVISKTATKGAIKKNTASRKISRLAKAIDRGLNNG